MKIMNNNLLLILGMTLVTYIPRLLPFLIVSNKKLPEDIHRFLSFVPYTTLGALIIPGVFYAIPDMPITPLLSIGFVAVYTWHRGGIIVPVLGSILLTFIIFLITT